MKLGDFIDQIVKIWEISMRQNVANFHKNAFSQNYPGTHSIHKNEARELKFGVEVPQGF